jgi:sarcosine oxidase
MIDTADIVVVGLGAMGAATLHRLARRGARVVGIDRFDPPHTNGSTHGETRITRLAVAEGPEYVPLVRRSHALWREMEAETGETLFVQNGGVVIATGDGAPSHGKPAFLGATIAIARSHGIPHEILDAAEVRRRWPQFRVRDHERAYFEPEAGVLFPERAVAAQLHLARRHGATVRPNEQVLAVTPRAGGITLTTDKGLIEAGQVVLTAGPWLAGLVPGIAAHTRVQRQTQLWFAPERPELYAPAACPIFIWSHGPHEEDYLYGFPALPGGSGVKSGTERYGAATTPETVDRAVPEAEWRSIHARHIAPHLDGLGDRLTKSSTCLYTCTPDAGFIVEQSDRIIAASPCSGHGFKHSPAMGEHLAAMALDRVAAGPAFALARFAPPRFEAAQ